MKRITVDIEIDSASRDTRLWCEGMLNTQLSNLKAVFESKGKANQLTYKLRKKGQQEDNQDRR